MFKIFWISFTALANDLDLNVSIFQFFVISNVQICEIQWLKPAGFIMFGKFGSYRIGVSTVVSLILLSRYVAASIARSRNWRTELDHGAGQDKVPVSWGNFSSGWVKSKWKDTKNSRCLIIVIKLVLRWDIFKILEIWKNEICLIWGPLDIQTVHVTRTATWCTKIYLC